LIEIKKIYAAAGFGASLKDWGKIAIHSIKMRNGSEGQCISKFAQDATNGRIDELKHKNLNYGYQIWIQPFPKPKLESEKRWSLSHRRLFTT
jgi:hypothetical protein